LLAPAADPEARAEAELMAAIRASEQMEAEKANRGKTEE
jgi:hypothetical protein